MFRITTENEVCEIKTRKTAVSGYSGHNSASAANGDIVWQSLILFEDKPTIHSGYIRS